MIQEDYVSFEVAKLLKDKGFNEATNRYYNAQYDGIRTVSDTFMTYWNNENHMKELMMEGAIAIPTLQMVCKWLREVHNIFIEIYMPSHSEHEDTIYHGTYSFDIFNLNTKGYVYCTWNEPEFNSYEEAIEAGIKYTLENLI